MVHQALADAGEARQHRNPHVPEMPDRADAGAQQMRRRMDRAGREDDFAAAELLLAAIDQRLDADALRAFEQQLLHLRVGRDRQVGALARGAIEIAHRGRDALLVLVGMRHRKIAVDELAVLVGQELEAGLLAGLGHRLACLVQCCCGMRRTGMRPSLPCIRPVEIEVVLDLPEIGQHVVPAPARRRRAPPTRRSRSARRDWPSGR